MTKTFHRMSVATFTHQRNLLPKSNQGVVESIHLIKSDNNDIIICVRQGRELIGYKYEEKEDEWIHQWSETVFNFGVHTKKKYPLVVTDKVFPGKTFLVLRHPDGVRFYYFDQNKPGLQLLREDGNFHDVYNYNLIFGIFFPSDDWLGVMTRDLDGKVEFFVATSDSLNPEEPDPLFPPSESVSLSPSWKSPDTKLFVSKLFRNESEVIGLQRSQGLDFYKFDSNFLLQHVISTSQITQSFSEDYLFFADITHGQFKDILHLDKRGLLLYSYSLLSNDYVLIHQDVQFTQPRGWLPSYSKSMKVADLNKDGQDDLIFTGPQGLTALTYDSSVGLWKLLIDPDSVQGQNRYATVVATLPAIAPVIMQPSIFVQDTEGKLQWARISRAPVTTPRPNPPPVTAAPLITTTTTMPKQTLYHGNTLAPEKIARTNLPEKPVLWWAQQWSDSFLKEPVDTASGHVRFNVPLIDLFPSTGWQFQLSLSYNSQARVSELIGLGWSLPLTQDYIFVDYRGSVFPEDAEFYFVMGGNSLRLRTVLVKEDVQHFEIVDNSKKLENITIKYYHSEQRWMVEDESAQDVYGKANNRVAKDALHWGLGWQNWRGIGTDKVNQIPLINAWYLNTHFDKEKQRSLYYFYEMETDNIPGGKPYTSAIRLQSISDSQEMRVQFSYAPKTDTEYSSPNPMDSQGNVAFPVALSQPKFLKSYHVTTSTYTQTIRFVYEVEDGKRLLTGIQQQLLTLNKLLLEFTYQPLLENKVIKRCTSSSRKLTVEFKYEIVTPASLKNNVISYPVREAPQISSGQDYTVMAYQDFNPAAGKVIFRIMNREMTRTIIDCSINTELSCPAEESAIIRYSIQAFRNSFLLLIETRENRRLHFFNRNELTWSKDSNSYIFSKEALIQISPLVIAVASPSEHSITLLERADNKSKWTAETISTSRPIKSLAVHNTLVIAYDDFELWLICKGSSDNWEKRILNSDLGGVISTNKRTVSSFDLTSDLQNQLLNSLNKNALQVLNNLISISTVEILNGKMTSKIYLLLLNTEAKVELKEVFEISRANILETIRKTESKDGNYVYHIGYIYENGLYKVRVKDVSGRAIESYKNKNRKADAIKDEKERVNESLKHDKETSLVDWGLCHTQISQRGVYCGNDTFLRTTGIGWKREQLPTSESIALGKHFVLESHSQSRLFKLYKQNEFQTKLGQPLEELQLEYSGQLVNRYPGYLAFQEKPNVLKVLTFKDERTLGDSHTFGYEQLLGESDWQNLLTVVTAPTSTNVHSESKECLVRPLSTLVSSRPHVSVNELTTSDGEFYRLIGYEHSFAFDTDERTYNEAVIVIPGNKKPIYGWYNATRSYHMATGNTTTTESWFDNNGLKVLKPLEIDPSTHDSNESNVSDVVNPGYLFDRSGLWLISDFSQFNLAHEVAAFYGFEEYESDKIGFKNGTNSIEKRWYSKQGKIIRNHFALTGRSYLQLSSSSKTSAFLEGVFKPHDQDNIYLASCWVRCYEMPEINSPASYLKATVSTTDGQKIIVLLGEVRRKFKDWFYIELQLDFKLLHEIYQKYLDYNIARGNDLKTAAQDSEIVISLRVEAPYNQAIDIDHIRFSPLTHDFQAKVYHPLTGKCTETIEADGSITKTLYNEQQEEMATINDDDKLKRFTSSSKTGMLVPTVLEIKMDGKPSTLTIEPEHGFYEDFGPFTWNSRWTVKDAFAWNVAPGQLWHTSLEKHDILANEELFDSKSVAFRFYFALQTSGATLNLSFPNFGSLVFSRQPDSFTVLELPKNRSIHNLLSAGEVVLLIEQNYVWLWLDGVLLLDETSSGRTGGSTAWPLLALQAQGKVLVQDLLVMNSPRVTVDYYNAFGEKVQEIKLEDAQTVQVKETIYDELGREAVTTKVTRIKRKENQALLAYHSNFVTHKNPADQQSIWYTGKLNGAVNVLNAADEGVAYARTEYVSNPTNEVKALGLPGKDFTTKGRFATKLGHNSNISFLENLFPSDQGYRQKVEYISNGSFKISVFDKQRNKVARYVRVPGYNHLLSTYEYDTKGRLIKILPPLYHQKVVTEIKVTRWQPGEKHLSLEEREWQGRLASRFFYDESGNLKIKIDPDSGNTHYMYNKVGQMRFMVSSNLSNKITKTVYYDYDGNGQLSCTGYLDFPLGHNLTIDVLKGYLERKYLPNVREYQHISYADDHPNPSLRGRIKHYITHNFDDSIVEKMVFNKQENILSKSAMSLKGQEGSDDLSGFEKEYSNGVLYKLTYPIKVNDKPLQVVHNYNKLGKLVSLGTNENPTQYALFTYLPTGELSTEQYLADTSLSFTRYYHYNSPGFLKQISDPYLQENIAYTEKGYGQDGYGDGMVMQTEFIASWPISADRRWFQIDDSDLEGNFTTLCLSALRRSGYLNSYNQPVNLFVPKLETTLPLVCGGVTGQQIAKLVDRKRVPGRYGHSYAYGNHQELVKAKYFDGESVKLSKPLQVHSFANSIPSLNIKQSEHVWQILVNAGYLVLDQQRSDPSTTVGKRGKSFFRSKDLFNDLSALNPFYTLYVDPIQQLILIRISKRQTLTLHEFEEAFLNWQGIDQRSAMNMYNLKKGIAKSIGEMLLDKNYFPNQSACFTSALDTSFTAVLNQYSTFLPEIVQVLLNHFAYALGESPFDIESYNIDANGNHNLFYTGYDRFELIYHNNSNQIQKVKINLPNLLNPETTFDMEHDSQGNVVKALHKGIHLIEYHPVSQRATRITLTDGRVLKFVYDAQGERLFKRVFDAENKLTHETFYLRDEQGRVLLDRTTNYVFENIEKIVTAYLYGPRGLIGFIRNNEFYSITTDHAGSVRLVVRAGKVVAVYDYLPYGQLMRCYGNDKTAHIIYRYTGQEWDEETGLYNYHARLYDPNIGRFYQPDPKSQYFSPYKYAGNSPLSTIDHDGEFAFLLACIIIGATAGAYLGGAAANNRWNPADWDGGDLSTYLGVFGGAIAGGLLPVGFGASVTTIGLVPTIALGGGGAYLMTAAANQNWDITKWKWDRPDTWNAMFQGFGAGSGIAGGVGLAHNFAKNGKVVLTLGKFFQLSRGTMKSFVLTVSYSAGGGVAYAGGVMANNGNGAFWTWDFTNPGTWSAIVNGFDTGMGWPQNILEIGRGTSKLFTSPQAVKRLLGNGAPIKQSLKTILKDPCHPLYKVSTSLVMSYFMGASANEELDITKWKLYSFSTYEGVLNGIFFGKDTTNMLNYALRSNVNLSPRVSGSKYRVQKGINKISHILDDFTEFRTKMEYRRLMENAFASESWRHKLKQLKDQSQPTLRAVEEFFKRGLESWKNGKTHPIKSLQRLVISEANLNLQSSSKKLHDWKKDSEYLSKKRKEVLSEQEVEFLNCYRAGRRRKRTAMGSITCSAESGSDSDSERHQKYSKPEIFEMFFENDPGLLRGIPESDGYKIIQPGESEGQGKFLRTSPEGLTEHISLILEKTPNVLAPTKAEFFPNFILGSLLTIPVSKIGISEVHAKIDSVEISYIRGDQKRTHNILKTAFKLDDESLVLKTFIAEDHGLTSSQKKGTKEIMHEHFKDELSKESVYTRTELDKLSSKIGMKGNFKIVESVFYINPDNTLSVKSLQKTKESYIYKDEQEEVVKTSNSRKSSKEVIAQTKEFKKIELSKGEDFSDLEKISTNDISIVEEGVKELSIKLLEKYKENAQHFGFSSTSESGFHAFCYGSLSLNFKYRFDLDIYVERIAGKGYADLIFLSRQGAENNKNWYAVPIIVEFKADRTSSKSATDQATGTGYFYNLSMRTVAKKAVVVGINSNFKSTPKVKEAIDISTRDIPQYEGFLKKLVENADNENLAEIVEEQLQHLYYSISPLAIKTKAKEVDNYLSRLVLGEILSQHEVHVLAENEITTILFNEKNKWIMLNLVESSTKITRGKNKDMFEFKNIDDSKLQGTLPNNLNIDNLLKIDIKINSKSKHGWSVDKPKRTVNQSKDKKEKVTNHPEDNQNLGDKKYYYLQEIESKSLSSSDTLQLKKSSKFEKVNVPGVKNIEMELSHMFNLDLSAVKMFIKSESDFQAVLQGLYHGIGRTKVIDGTTKSVKVFPEANPSKEGRIDLVVFKIGEDANNNVITEDLTIAELKFVKNNENMKTNLDNAETQVLKYINSNLKTFTDSEMVKYVAAIYDQSDGRMHLRQGEVEVPRTSYEGSPEASAKRERQSSSDSDINIQALSLSSQGKNTKPAKATRLGNRDKRSLYDETGGLQEKDDMTTNYYSIGSEGNLIQKWSIALISKVQTVVSSFFASAWSPDNIINTSNNTITVHHSHGMPGHQGSPSVGHSTGPTVLEMGDQWIRTTDINGLMAWGILLARKWSGYKPNRSTSSRDHHEMSAELDIRSAELVDAYMDMLLEHAEAFGIRPVLAKTIETPEFYQETKKLARKQLITGHFEAVPKLLYKQFVEKMIQERDLYLTEIKVTELLRNIKESLSKLQHMLSQEPQWLFHRLHSSEDVPAQYFNGEDVDDDANVIVQAIV